jgi:DNA modification methylase
MLEINKIHNYNCLEGLKLLDDNSVDCCVTSPPYWGLRDYGMDEQIGLEKTPEEYVATMVQLFHEVKRVLKPEGTLWLNLGDSYVGGKGQSGSRGGEYQEERNENGESLNKGYQTLGGRKETRPTDDRQMMKLSNLKPKDLVGIPWMTAFALRADGWYLRQDIIWHKRNPMPESVTDRCTKSHEYIFLMSKSQRYYFDYEAIRTPMAESSIARLSQDIENQEGSDRVPGKTNGKMKAVAHKTAITPGQTPQTKALNRMDGIKDPIYEYANKRDVWTVNTKPYKEAHFAVYPEELIVDCIKAGCPKDGIILDPFMGSGTTAVVARKLDRNFIGFELNPKYIKIADKRLYSELGMFL